VDSRLQIFLAVARIGQLTQASARLNLSPSSVSAQITALEQDLGVTLFHRRGRGMDLTPSGQILFSAAEQMEFLWRKTVRDVQAHHEGIAQIRIAASHTAAELFLPRPLGRFRSKWPETRVHLTMTNSQSVVDMVTGGTVDIGIVEGASEHSRLHHEELWTDELGLIVAAHHPLAGRRSLGVEELGELDWILREEGSGTRRVFERALEQAAIPVRHLSVMMQLSSLRAIVAMVANNVGVSVVSRAVFDSDEITVSNIVPIAIERLNLRRTLEAVLPTEPSSSMVEHLLEDLRRDVEIRQKRTRLT
jgi:DNA-binding transcriptional LysR family regulator